VALIIQVERKKFMAILEEIYESVIDGDLNGAKEGVNAALAQGIAPSEILNKGLIAAMTEVGRLFEEGEYFVPEMLVAARAMQAGVAILKPKLVEEDVKPLGKVVIGTVKGDLHDIGKNLVAMMLEGAGFEVVDLGTDVTPEKFVQAVKEHQAQFIGMSALLTTTMPSMRTSIERLHCATMPAP
jgi:5-methyltetrahydrofolate--homocysteine methyltransferase